MDFKKPINSGEASLFWPKRTILKNKIIREIVVILENNSCNFKSAAAKIYVRCMVTCWSRNLSLCNVCFVSETLFFSSLYSFFNTYLVFSCTEEVCVCRQNCCCLRHNKFILLWVNVFTCADSATLFYS